MKKILVVDDSNTDRAKIEGILAGAGYNVVTAASGQEAVEKSKSESPDAIFMDVIMEPMNGFQACRTITEDAATSNIPIILVSSKSESADKVWAEEQGAKAYITKPYEADQILDQAKMI